MRALGYLPSPPKRPGEKPDWNFNALCAKLAPLRAAPPPKASLLDNVLDVLDQGNLGSCVANAGAQAIRMRHVAQGVTPVLFSRLMMYYLARKADNAQDIDAGTFPRRLFEMLSKFGFCSEELWPYDDGPDVFRVQPSTEAISAAFDQRSPVSYHRIMSAGAARFDDMKRAISSGFPVQFGCTVSKAFTEEAFDPNKPLAPPAAGTEEGGHSMLFVGYNGDVFTVLNSWSKDFGVDGTLLFAPEYTLATDDLWVVEHAPVEGEI